MKKYIISILLLSVSLSIFAQQHKVYETLTEKDHENEEWKNKISETEDVTDFTFKLVTTKEKEYYPHFSAIQIFDRKSGRFIQEIDLLPYDYTQWLGPGNIGGGDFNFDGHADFSLFASHAAGANTVSLYFLYDPATGTFFESGFDGANLEFYPSDRTIVSTNQGMGGSYYIVEKYTVENNAMVLIDKRDFIVHADDGEFIEMEMSEDREPLYEEKGTGKALLYCNMRPGQIVLEGYEYTDKVIYTGSSYYDREYLHEEGDVSMYVRPDMGDKWLVTVEKDGNRIQVAYDSDIWLSYYIETGDEMEIKWSPMYYEAADDGDTIRLYIPTITDFPVLRREVVFMAPQTWNNASEDGYIFFKKPGDDKVDSSDIESGDEDGFHRGDTVSITLEATRYWEPGEEGEDDDDPYYIYWVTDIQMVAPGHVTKFWQECKKEIEFEKQGIDDPNIYEYGDFLNFWYAHKEMYEYLASAGDPDIVKSLNNTATEYCIYLSLFPKTDRESREEVEVKAEIWDRDFETRTDTLVATLAIKKEVDGSTFRFIDENKRGTTRRIPGW